jgi:DNA invertase Pin-like site-specific DNA recombinase
MAFLLPADIGRRGARAERVPAPAGVASGYGPAEPSANTGTSTGRLMIAVLGGLADVERDLIRTRTAEGRSRAKARGKHMGRPPSLTPAQQKEATRRRAQGATLQELADSYDRSIATMRRATREA